MARHAIEIAQDVFEGLCEIQCTLEEISGVLGVSEDTIERWCKRTYKQNFADAYKRLSAGGKASLRRSQFAMSETNPTMAIWLGKQYLGQTDKTESSGKISFAPDPLSIALDALALGMDVEE